MENVVIVGAGKLGFRIVLFFAENFKQTKAK